MDRLYFIVNPVSGSGEGMRRFSLVRGILEKRGVEYGFCFSEYPGHAVKLAKAAIDAGETRLWPLAGTERLTKWQALLRTIPA